VLAGLRTRPGVTVAVRGERAWVRWPPGESDVLLGLLAAPGVELFTQREGLWFRLGSRLPCFDVPADEGVPLAAALTPAPLTLPEPVRPSPSPCPLRLVRDDRPRPASALLAPLAEVARWAETATTRQLTSLRSARAGDVVLLLGERLPPLPGATRFSGRVLLAPLGWRPEPDLPEAALAEALGLGPGDIGLLTDEGLEVLPDSAFAPLSRAGVRLAFRPSPPRGEGLG
jgi:hypothetical protein